MAASSVAAALGWCWCCRDEHGCDLIGDGENDQPLEKKEVQMPVGRSGSCHKRHGSGAGQASRARAGQDLQGVGPGGFGAKQATFGLEP